jgi:hypothetical protein
MVDEFTANYSMLCPKPVDTMSQRIAVPDPFLAQNIRDAFERIEAAANPAIVAAPPLPSAGNFRIGDRLYLSDATYRSSFVLLSKDANWGWIWRPIQAAIGPWHTIPGSAFNGPDSATWASHPTKPLQVALSNKGHCHWRGAIRKSTVGLPNNNSLEIFANMPNGIKHHTVGMYTLAIDPATPQSDVSLAGYKGGRWYIQPDGYNSLRFHNATTAQDVYFDGLEYVVSNMHYYSP